jgi:hypothetical protein
MANALVHGDLADDEAIEVGVLRGRERVRVWVAAGGEAFPAVPAPKPGRGGWVGVEDRRVGGTIVGRQAGRTANGRLVRGLAARVQPRRGEPRQAHLIVG